MSANTILSDINEIYTGYILAGKSWFDKDAKKQYELRLTQSKYDDVLDAQAKAEVMAAEFLKWAAKNKYKKVSGVWWTARPGSMTDIVGRPVDQSKNPTDILVKFSSGPSDGFLGLSAKATKGSGDIGFKNPGIGTVDKSLKMKMSETLLNTTNDLIKKLELPPQATARKAFIRSNPTVKQKTEQAGIQLMSDLRDTLLQKLRTMDQKSLFKYLLTDWMDANIIYPPYIKVTGHGSSKTKIYHATIVDPLTNPKVEALSKYPITLEPIGNESIGVKAGDKKIMKMRFKFESEKMASSMKMSGDPW